MSVVAVVIDIVVDIVIIAIAVVVLLLVIGFVESEYQGEERGQDHDVLAGYISGLPDNRLISYTPTAITASELVRIETHSFCQSSKLCMY